MIGVCEACRKVLADAGIEQPCVVIETLCAACVRDLLAKGETKRCEDCQWYACMKGRGNLPPPSKEE